MDRRNEASSFKCPIGGMGRHFGPALRAGSWFRGRGQQCICNAEGRGYTVILIVGGGMDYPDCPIHTSSASANSQMEKVDSCRKMTTSGTAVRFSALRGGCIRLPRGGCCRVDLLRCCAASERSGLSPDVPPPMSRAGGPIDAHAWA